MVGGLPSRQRGEPEAEDSAGAFGRELMQVFIHWACCYLKTLEPGKPGFRPHYTTS